MKRLYRLHVIAALAASAGAPACYAGTPLDEAGLLAEVRATRARPVARSTTNVDLGAPLTERSAIAVADALNLDLRAARSEVPIAKALTVEAQTWRNPELRYSGDTGGELSQYERALYAVSLYPPNPVEHPRRVAAADAELPVAEAKVEEVAWTLRRDVRIAFVRVAHARAREGLAVDLVTQRGRRVELLRTGTAGGYGDPLELTRAELALLDAKELALRSQEHGRMTRTDLARILGLSSDEDLRLADASDALACTAPAADTKALEDTAIAQLPSIRVARLAYARADAQLRAEYGRRMPWVQVLQVGWDSSPIAGRSSWRVGGAVDVPIFTWNGGKLASARANLEKRRLDYARALTSALADAGMSLRRWKDLHARYERLVRETRPALEAAQRAAARAVTSGRQPELFLLDIEERKIALQGLIVDASLACREAAIGAAHAAGPTP